MIFRIRPFYRVLSSPICPAFVAGIFGAVMIAGIAGCGGDWLSKDVELGTADKKTTTSGSGTSGDAPEDSDGDGLSNAVESSFGMETTNANSDNDDFGDGVEFVGDGGDPLDQAVTPNPVTRRKVLDAGDDRFPGVDSDNDGLSDAYESNFELDPNSPDTDQDGYSDGLELVAQSDPFIKANVPSRDSLPADDGIVHNASSTPKDTDDDGVSDRVEQSRTTSTTKSDTDGDGFSDGIEYLVGSDPLNKSEVPNFTVPPKTSSSSGSNTDAATSTDAAETDSSGTQEDITSNEDDSLADNSSDSIDITEETEANDTTN